MTDFYTLLDEYMGDEFSLADIRAVVRRCWFYDFDGYPLRLWQGKGKLFTSDANEWLGTITSGGADLHETTSTNDGRDGSSANVTNKLRVIDLPGQPAFQTYNALKQDQWRVTGRQVTQYLALFNANEGLRPSTPIVFFKRYTMRNTKFSESIDLTASGAVVKKYYISVVCKDGNFGRSDVPGGTYADATQKERARQLGVAVDKGSEFLLKLANRTYQVP